MDLLAGRGRVQWLLLADQTPPPGTSAELSTLIHGYVTVVLSWGGETQHQTPSGPMLPGKSFLASASAHLPVYGSIHTAGVTHLAMPGATACSFQFGRHPCIEIGGASCL